MNNNDINSVELNSNTTIDSLIPVIDNIITNYCADNDINESDIFPLQWLDILAEIKYTLFYNTNILRYTPNINNEYNIDKVIELYEKIYKRICFKHNQEITMKAFSDMCNIDQQSFFDWENKLSSKGSEFHKRLIQDNEESLELLMHDRRNNPMKFLPSLNRKHGWNMPGTKTDSGGSIKLSLADLKKLPELTQNE